METSITAVKWTASISGIVAALAVSLDFGWRVTGWDFVIFSGSALCWLAGAVLSRDGAPRTQNVALLAIDVFGIYRYLIHKKAVG